MDTNQKPYLGAAAPAFSSLSLLQQQYPARAVIDCKELAVVTGACWKHIANLAAAGEYPIRNLKIGGKRVFTLVDVARFLDSGASPRRGRPRKIVAAGAGVQS